ncbi:PepSY domain-containing protein, partial [Romboutsia sp. MSSM.1001216sp_RTP31141st1_F12_RTP31141_220114]
DNAVGSATISVEKAKQIMLNKVPGALFVSFKYDKEDNEYEGELRKGNTEYDITVSAVDGRITDYDVDYDN